eukprot:m.603218 g.603218  ORF g.603218 m.603218 type:complete len:55 (+) comp22452_c3_seq11:1237-1401(+)
MISTSTIEALSCRKDSTPHIPQEVPHQTYVQLLDSVLCLGDRVMPPANDNTECQ